MERSGWAGVEKKVLPYEESFQLTRKTCTARQITVPEACAGIPCMRTELTKINTQACKSTL